jgi:aryl-alcohol dehydrogenase-like predicted oxidoreductase
LARGVETEILPICDKYGMGVITWSPLAGGWLSGMWRKDGSELGSHRSALLPDRYDLSKPGNQAKLDAADALANVADKAGITLIHLALAFVINHPAVTSAIIGPRTMEHLESQIGAADVTLAAEVLDQIDEIVPPGQNLLTEDAGYDPPSITQAWRRRRPHRD